MWYSHTNLDRALAPSLVSHSHRFTKRLVTQAAKPQLGGVVLCSPSAQSPPHPIFGSSLLLATHALSISAIPHESCQLYATVLQDPVLGFVCSRTLIFPTCSLSLGEWQERRAQPRPFAKPKKRDLDEIHALGMVIRHSLSPGLPTGRTTYERTEFVSRTYGLYYPFGKFYPRIGTGYDTYTYLSSSLSYERTQNLTRTGLKIAQSYSTTPRWKPCTKLQPAVEKRYQNKVSLWHKYVCIVSRLGISQVRFVIYMCEETKCC
ncbi:uncharacterized protein BDR25DRAFT_363061 [Lindgomyces ingoldianus]|uniref:Uncharacterized protein n=1 Tax=Lindgomyces ingoldianus TaxID=673940 RepID=A0ACB6Q871_9PLEO|nr:uncharacterized protein BDR25DRAFT_363061 [Lindgomyces ingoldianus]KAF2463153.1 hypothetical protein BDR25DRAFT_363061 [Lindgomyces ingoldianus]